MLVIHVYYVCKLRVYAAFAFISHFLSKKKKKHTHFRSWKSNKKLKKIQSLDSRRKLISINRMCIDYVTLDGEDGTSDTEIIDLAVKVLSKRISFIFPIILCPNVWLRWSLDLLSSACLWDLLEGDGRPIKRVYRVHLFKIFTFMLLEKIP